MTAVTNFFERSAALEHVLIDELHAHWVATILEKSLQVAEPPSESRFIVAQRLTQHLTCVVPVIICTNLEINAPFYRVVVSPVHRKHSFVELHTRRNDLALIITVTTADGC